MGIVPLVICIERDTVMQAECKQGPTRDQSKAIALPEYDPGRSKRAVL